MNKSIFFSIFFIGFLSSVYGCGFCFFDCPNVQAPSNYSFSQVKIIRSIEIKLKLVTIYYKSLKVLGTS